MFRIIKFIVTLSLLPSAIVAQEGKDSREMRFSWPAIDFTYSIQNGNPPGYDSAEYKYTYSCFKVNSSIIENWFIGGCTVETFNLACKIIDYAKIKKVETSDMVSPSQSSPIKENIFTFSVYENRERTEIPTIEGYVSKEDFIKLTSMLLNDVEQTNKQGKNLNSDSHAFETFLKTTLQKLETSKSQ